MNEALIKLQIESLEQQLKVLKSKIGTIKKRKTLSELYGVFEGKMDLSLEEIKKMRSCCLIKLLILPLLYTIVVGCATNVAVRDDVKYIPNTPFVIARIINESGEDPQDDTKDTVTLMKEALEEELTKSKLPTGSGGYSLYVTIDEYEYGSALKRMFTYGLSGRTKLSVVVSIKDKTNKQVDEIKVSKTIYLPIGKTYSIGAWKYIFSQVAQLIVEELSKHI